MFYTLALFMSFYAFDSFDCPASTTPAIRTVLWVHTIFSDNKKVKRNSNIRTCECGSI